MGAGAEAAGKVPGIEAVLAKTKRVTGTDTGTIQGVRNSLQSASDEAAGSHQAITSTLTGLPAAWHGSDADAFSGYLDKFTAASKAAKEHLDEGIAGLDKAVTALDDAKQEIEKALGTIADDYESTLKAANAKATTDNTPLNEGDKKSIANEAIKANEPAIDHAIQDAERALGEIAKDLHVSISGLDKQFSIMPHPKTGDSTTPQSAPVNYDGGGGGYSGGGGGYSGGGGGGGMGSSGGPPAGPVPGNVREWLREAIKELQAAGINVTDADIPKIWQIIQHESGGDPHAINDWDSNAANGTPSKGLMQTIDPTFNSYKLPGHGDIWNPVDNICAGVNYTISRYGSIDNTPGLASMASGGAYQGY